MITPTFVRLTNRPDRPIMLAVDTEFEDAATLTVQFAVRTGNVIRVQLYHAEQVPGPRPEWFGERFAARLTGKAGRIEVLPARPLTSGLSPARVLADLFSLRRPEYLSRAEGQKHVRSQLGVRKHGTRRRKGEDPRDPAGAVHVQLVGHFLRADFLRAFGYDFWWQLLLPTAAQPTGVGIGQSRVIGLRGTGAERFSPVAAEYVRVDDEVVPVRLSTFDTCAAYGNDKLDNLAQAFLGVGKVEGLSVEDKARMAAVFLERSKEAYRYALGDVVLTLELAERMADLHRDIYRGLGFDETDIPRCHSTPGRRVSTLILRDLARVANGSATLGSSGTASERKLWSLFAGGNAQAISTESRFGAQSGQIHGGLLFSRTPTALFHDAPGQFRDLDLGSCYPTVLRTMNVYVGRPVVWEPGKDIKTLKEVVGFLETASAGRDAWFVKVTGEVKAAPNALIPSTNNALTHRNYKKRAARARATAGLGKASASQEGHASLFTDEITAGVVVYATWKMIQALPPLLRAEYETLRVETVVFYPKDFVADSGPAFDALAEGLTTGADLDWVQRLDLTTRKRRTTEDLDEKYASLKYPIGRRLAKHLIHLRKKARKASGRGSGMDRAIKNIANTMYGALCSTHLPTQNVVAAQVVTGTVRAIAYAMAMSLNAHTVITDGCQYRRDQVPSGTFADCLKASDDYPIRRAEAGIGFLDPADIPASDREFMEWYPGHAMNFFGVAGKDYELLFGLHKLEHKALPGCDRVDFDGLCLYGAADYAKLVIEDGELTVAEFKARSYGEEAKEVLGTWLLRVCQQDAYDAPPPPVQSKRLLTVADAAAACRNALDFRTGVTRVVFPVGMCRRGVQTLKLLKPSQFVFRTARQKAKILKELDELAKSTGCGPELLALNKTNSGSVSKVAAKIYTLIREGKERLNDLNIHRFLKRNRIGEIHQQAVVELRQEMIRDFLAKISADDMPSTALLTGLTFTQDEIDLVKIE